MSAALTTELLEAICPPPGEVGELLACDYERSAQRAMGAFNAANARLVQLVRRGLLEGWWKQRGCHSPEHWLCAQFGLSWPRARRMIVIARELGAYPETAAEFARGLLTEDHVFEIVTRVDPAREHEIAGSAGRWNIGQLRRWSAAFPKPVEPATVDDHADDDAAPVADTTTEPEDTAGEGPAPFDLPPADPTPARLEPNVVAGGWDHRGRNTGRWDLDKIIGALLDKALRLARNKLYTERTGADPDDDDAMAGAARITGADALERLLIAALDALDPQSATGGRPSDRYQVLVHVNADAPERSRIHLGPLLTKAERQYLTCDADVRAVIERGGRPVDLGRRQRTVDDILRALVEDRDGGCIVCAATGFLHAHHVWHWEDGGPTDLENLVGACPRDHRLIHAGEIQILRDPVTGQWILLDRRGRPLPRPGPIPPERPPPAPNLYKGPIRGRRSRDRFTYVNPRWYRDGSAA